MKSSTKGLLLVINSSCAATPEEEMDEDRENDRGGGRWKRPPKNCPVGRCRRRASGGGGCGGCSPLLWSGREDGRRKGAEADELTPHGVAVVVGLLGTEILDGTSHTASNRDNDVGDAASCGMII